MALILAFALSAVTPQESMQRARALYDDAQYPEAIAAYDDVLARSDLPSATRREALLYQGFSHIALKQEDAARRSFRAVLTLEPTYSLPPYTAPKIRELFEDERKEVQTKPQILAKPAEFAMGKARFSFAVANLKGQHAVIMYRARGSIAYHEAALSGAPEAQVTIPVIEPRPAAFEYYAEVRDGISVSANAGSADAPLIFQLPRADGTYGPIEGVSAERTPVYKEWWLWTVVGVVVVGAAAGTAAYFLTRPVNNTGGLAVHYTVTP